MENEKNGTPQQELRLSIVIPVYNVEAYLDHCMQSLLPQIQGRPVEVLLINDGSTDDSGKLCKTYAEQYAQIRTVDQENGGASSARNHGMKLAQGQYIQFVDSDDWLEAGAVEQVLKALERSPDLLLINLNRYRNGVLESRTQWSSQWLKGGLDAMRKGLLARWEMCAMPQITVVKKSWVQEKELEFCEGIIHEDMEWVPHLLCEADTAAILDEPIYGYQLARQGSVMNGSTLQRHYESLLLVGRTLMGESSGYDTVRQALCKRAAGLSIFMAMGYAAQLGDETAQGLEKEIKADLLLRPARWYGPKKYRLCCLLGGGLAQGIKQYQKRFS